MQTNKVSFGNLYQTTDLLQKVANRRTKKAFLQNYIKVRNLISENGLDRKKYVDIILSNNNDDTFVATISSKKQGTPYNPGAQFSINFNDDWAKKLQDWVKNWNGAYNPKTIEADKRFIRQAVDLVISRK